MKSNLHISSPASQQGVVILESLIAILIFSMGILALVGLQAAMIKSTSDAKYRAEASFIAQQRLGVMWMDAANLADYATAAAGIAIAELPNGTLTVTVPAAGQASVTVAWQQPGDDSVHRFTTNARIIGD